jgi:low temperature requirement protein LtrA
MVEQRQAQRRGRVLGGIRATGEDHRATTFELFFDLVYVFAATQVTGYMAHEHSGHGVLQGLLLLALLWGTWSAYAWLGNQARADEGLLRVGMAVAMAAIFVVALTIPEAWHDAPGGLNGPLVLVGAYLLVRGVHLILYAVAATGDRGLRRQLAITCGPLLAGAALLLPGALLGGWTQTLLFAAALLVDWGGIYLTSRHGNWRLHSVAHLTERHGLFIILAIGESVVAIGVGAAQKPISAPLLVAAILGVVAALGVEGVMAHADEAKPLGDFYAPALFGGVALYLAGHLLFKRRMHSALSLPRLVAMCVLLAALPAAVVLPPLVGLAGLVLILAALVIVETTRDAQTRRSLRNA